ncbi:MAG: helix-turn-helix transcriptional regulator [Armatimonadetes bacterium]|nr:helix-turn-helix transcriptional regulator [Armatimonadota bacterium]
MSSENTVHRREHDALLRLIVKWRLEAGLSQRQLSARLQKRHNFIVEIETGQRGVSVVELVDIVRALELTVPQALNEYAKALTEPGSLP